MNVKPYNRIRYFFLIEAVQFVLTECIFMIKHMILDFDICST